jgi:hypothetical protein
VSRIPKLSSKRPEYGGELEEYSKQAVSLRSTEEYNKLVLGRDSHGKLVVELKGDL